MSKILFLHHNFPAQFKFIALDFAALGHEVVFLSEHNSVGQLEGLKNLVIKTSESKHHSNLDGQLACGKRFNLAMQELKQEGWSPDFVISHTGWGCGLDVQLDFQPKNLLFGMVVQK